MLTGERVVLRRVEPDDYPAIQRWQNDPEIFRWMDYERPFTLADIRESEERAAGEGHPFIVEVDGTAVGRIGINQISARDRTGSLYLFIGERRAWGNGYAREALRVLLTYAFDVLNLRLVELWTLADNERALRLYKSVGFVEEATLRARSVKERVPVARIVMSITPAELAAAAEEG